MPSFYEPTLSETEILKTLKPDSQKQLFATMMTGQRKSKGVYMGLLFTLGCIGMHRFYLGDIAIGVLYALMLATSWMILPGFLLVCCLLADVVRVNQIVDDTNNSIAAAVATHIKATV